MKMTNQSPTNSPSLKPSDLRMQPSVTVQYNFLGGVEKIMDGYTLTKLEWGNHEIKVKLFDDRLCIYGVDDDEKWHPWIITIGDLLGDDWIIIKGE